MRELSIRRFDPAVTIPYSRLFDPGVSFVTTQGFEFETRPTRPSIRTVLSGQATYEFDGLRRTIEPGEALFVGTDARLTGGTTRTTETTCFSIYFGDDVFSGTGWRSAFLKLSSFANSNTDAVAELAAASSASRPNRIHLNRLYQSVTHSAQSQLLHFAKIAQHLPAKKARTRNGLIALLEKGRMVIEARIYEDIDAGSVARAVGMAPSHFAHAFRSAYSMTPRQYHERLRMKEAKRLIATTTMPLSSIAEYLGYSSASSFSRTFARVEDQSPRSFRNQAR